MVVPSGKIATTSPSHSACAVCATFALVPPLAAEGSRRELAAEVRAQLAAKLAESVPVRPVAEPGRAQAAAEWSADG